MFVKGRDRIIAVDAYNGTILWEKGIPNFSRSGANIDPGPMVVTEDYLYAAAEDKCLALDVATGKNVITFKVPEVAKGEAHEWGYVASVDNLLFGSGQKPGASPNPYKGSKYEEYGVIHNIDVDHLSMVETKSVVASNFLFALNRHSGKKLWVYNSGGVIPNIGIAVGDGRIYFLENTDPKALAEDKGGRVPLEAMTKSSLVALDIKTGKKIWSKEVDLSKAHFILFLSHANGTLLLTYSSRGGPPGFPEYYLDAFDAGSGKAKWSTHYGEITSNIPDERSKDGYDSGLRTIPLKKRTKAVQSGRGKETHHPVIIANRIISEPFEFDLQTGKRGELKLIRSGRGCGTISASSKSIFFRAATLATYDLNTGKNYRISNTARPGCWLNVLPVGGLILMPEATSGCICNYPVQATFAYIPR